jgi:hypothetical protein
MINKMTKIVEKNVAELLMIALFTAVFLSSCATSKPYHACGITELNKQYTCK